MLEARLVAGDPIWVPPDAGEAELEFARVQLERALNAVTARAYALAGADLKRATPPNLEDPSRHPPSPTSASRPIAPA